MVALWLINIILWVSFAFYNYAFITKKLDFHFWGAVVSIVIVTGMAFLCFIPFTIDQIISIPFISLVLRWIVFDITLNVLMKKPWYYYGSVTKGEKNAIPLLKNGKIDRILGWKQIPIKFVLLIVIISISI